ncbi:MAG TPA: DUF4199 domain-containing protein [Gammaproteobacteria bacterium]|nr:DUF4199 domain-containing protein [Gammaproteobacteria bacterium]
MIRLILIYGAIAGVIVAVPMVVLMLTLTEETAPDNGALYGYLTMIVALTTVFLGIKHYRDKMLGGVIRFWPALAVGLAISAVAGVIYVIGWEISLASSGFDFGAAMSKMMVDAARARGASELELESVAAQAAAFARMYENPLYRLPITFVEIFPIGVLISFVSAGLLRNSGLLPARGRA